MVRVWMMVWGAIMSVKRWIWAEPYPVIVTPVCPMHGMHGVVRLLVTNTGASDRYQVVYGKLPDQLVRGY